MSRLSCGHLSLSYTNVVLTIKHVCQLERPQMSTPVAARATWRRPPGTECERESARPCVRPPRRAHPPGAAAGPRAYGRCTWTCTSAWRTSVSPRTGSWRWWRRRRRRIGRRRVLQSSSGLGLRWTGRLWQRLWGCGPRSPPNTRTPGAGRPHRTAPTADAPGTGAAEASNPHASVHEIAK